jgi:phosphatidate phosphatase APP1
VSSKIPILLSFYGLCNGATTLIFGQVTYTKLNDLSFKDYNRRKTFRTLLSLYQTKAYSRQEIILVFDNGDKVKAKTNAHGAFYEKAPVNLTKCKLQKVLVTNEDEVRLIEGLYERHIHCIESDTIVVSDIDDTLLHSFINKRFLKFRTLMFTTMEKRKAVGSMQELMNNLSKRGAVPFYLSNSEQNLYPLIYRFLHHNNFPPGPLFLKQMRKLKDVLLNIKFPPKNIHKTTTLTEILSLFPTKKFVLMGDNTQHDLSIYLSVIEQFGNSIQYIIIRKVVEKKEDTNLIIKASEKLKSNNITLYYSDTFPSIVI